MGATAMISACAMGAAGALAGNPARPRNPYEGMHDGPWFIAEAERQSARANRRAAFFVILLSAFAIATYFVL